MVPSLTPADLDDIHELRMLLETEAVRQAAARVAEGGEVEAALKDAKAAAARGDADAFIDANRRFRAGWLELVRNRRLVRMVELYADHVRALQGLTLGDKPRQRKVLRGMQAILDALQKRDPDAAAAAMRNYLAISRDAMQAVCRTPD
jgi:DNA-binding GntR family transcriptional regulator